MGFSVSCDSEEKWGPSGDVLLTGQVTEVIEEARRTYVKNDIRGSQKFFTGLGYKK